MKVREHLRRIKESLDAGLITEDAEVEAHITIEEQAILKPLKNVTCLRDQNKILILVERIKVFDVLGR